jgi:hypothetical protein
MQGWTSRLPAAEQSFTSIDSQRRAESNLVWSYEASCGVVTQRMAKSTIHAVLHTHTPL